MLQKSKALRFRYGTVRLVVRERSLLPLTVMSLPEIIQTKIHANILIKTNNVAEHLLLFVKG